MLKKIHVFISIITGILLYIAANNCLAASNYNDTTNNNKAKDSAYFHTTISAQDLQKLATVIAEIKKYYVKPVTDKELFDNAISGMLNGLDPHSEYLKRDDLESLEMLTVGHFGGIGVEVLPDQGLIKIISPLDDTPAAKAGIKAGDTIIQINNKLVKDMQLHEAIKLMRGPKGSKLTLTIIRKDTPRPLTFHLKRDIIKIQSVKEQLLEPGFGYLRIAFFQETTNDDMVKALEKLKKQAGGNLKGLIIDMRNNPGGLLDAAIQMADNFLDSQRLGKNNIIVYTKGSSDSARITARATPGELLPNVPLVVLINEGSASAAEVVAGALQDYKRAVIVGTKSFGKGSVQTLLPVDNESAIKLTTALYYTPLDRSIQAKGIEPDVVIADLKLPKKININDDYIARISESNLVDHLQNGNEETPPSKTTTDSTATDNTDATDTSAPTDITEDQTTANSTNKLDLAHKDYQLYETLNILKVLQVTSKAKS